MFGMMSGRIVLLGCGWVVLAGCDRPSAGPTVGEKPKQVIDAAEATRVETEKKQAEQREAIKAALGDGEPAAK